MDTTAILKEAEQLGMSALGDLVTSLEGAWAGLPANIKKQAENAVQRLAQAKALRLAGMRSESVLTPADERAMLALLDSVKVAGGLSLRTLAIASVNNVIMAALELAGSALRKFIGLP